MKFILFYALIAFGAAATAVPSQLAQDPADIVARDFDDEILVRRYLKGDLEEREYFDEDFLEERKYDDGKLSARYLDTSYELSEREYQELDERFAAVAVRVAVQAIKMIVNAIKDQIEKDKNMRGEWTVAMVNKFRQQYPHFNFVVCHTDHHTDFKGTKGVDWGHSHQELDVSFHKTIGFEIYWFKEGTFHRTGDGGFLNWAYNGNIISKSNGGKDVTFGRL